MTTPATRTPVRIARGTYSDLNASIADLYEGEICYATDQDKIYVKESGSLVSTQANLSGYVATSSIDQVGGVQGYSAANAVTDTAQQFTKAQRGTIESLTFNASLTIDFSLANNYKVTQTAGMTVNTPTNLVAGQAGSIFISMDGTGGHSLGWSTAFKFPGQPAQAPSNTTTASATDRYDYIVLDATASAEIIHIVQTKNY
jgi:hypothetical protein